MSKLKITNISAIKLTQSQSMVLLQALGYFKVEEG